MAVKFTREQQEAIDLHGCNILVSAAAGSGKTAVLAERIVKMVCDEERQVDIDRLLIVTFTNAAAAEMRERIAGGISKRLAQGQDSEHVQKQATLLHNAQITTIDSFCLFLLRNHFNEIGLDPAFRIADEGEVKLMQQEALQELLEDAYASGSEAFRYCVEYFCPGGRESVLEQHILNLSRYASSFPWPTEWLEERKKDYQGEGLGEICSSPYAEWLTEHLRRMMEGCVEKYKSIVRLCDDPEGPYMYKELVERELEQLEAALAYGSLEEFEAGLGKISFGRLPSKKDETVLAAKRDLAKELRAGVKDCVQSLGERFFATPLELAARQGRACRGPVETLLDLALEFHGRMQEKKQEKKVIDFSDMEHFALDILLDRSGGQVRPSPVAMEYRQHFAEVLTDEYQDSNLVQEYLLQAVSGEEDGRFNRFMVGDVKQSIYKFRLARPELFLDKYKTYEEGQGNCRRIDLAKNFRSRPEVVDTVNELFGRMMSRDVGGIEYDHRAALYAGAEYPESDGCHSELLLVEKPDKGEEEDAKQAEALAVARKIKELRGGFRVFDRESGCLREARYSDMVILLRTNSGWDEEFKEVLEQEGIPAYIASKTGYFAASEVQELLNFLRVLDNPSQDVPLFGVMKSVFGGFSEEEIAKIRSGRRDCCLYEALKEAAGDLSTAPRGREAGNDLSAGADSAGDASTAPRGREEVLGTETGDGQREDGGGSQEGGWAVFQGDPEDEDRDAFKEDWETGEELREKAAAFLNMLRKYRDCTVYLPVRELLSKLVTDFGYLDYVTALPAGGKRRANVEMLFARASDFEKTSYFGLFHFVRYMEQLEKYDVDYGEAGELDENADVVRIMSIHKSKGLEFPVTIVSGLSKRFNMQDANQAMILDMDLGLGVDYVDPDKRVRNKTLRKNVLSRKLREDSLAEELRVLYVAMTRAREKLILTGVLENAGEQWENWLIRSGLQEGEGSGRLTYLDFMEAGSYLELLLPVLPYAHVQVSVTGKAQSAAGKVQEQAKLFQRRELLGQLRLPEDPETAQGLIKRLNAEYPYRGLADLYTKTTVSELKIAAMADKDEAAYHTFEEKEIQPYIPMFRRGEEKIGGTVRGNAYHRVMELMDFQQVLGGAVGMESSASAASFAKAHGGDLMPGEGGFPRDYEEYARRLDPERLAQRVGAFLRRESEEGRLTEEYLQAVGETKIMKFLSSDTAYRMWRADCRGELFREQPFVLGIDARRLKEEFSAGETVLIQGIVDVFFVEEDGLTLLDYKTDSVSSMGELWNRYETQLDYYQEALEKLTGKPVKERILYSFHLGKAGAAP